MQSSPTVERPRFPQGLVVFGWISLLATSLLSLRLLYEQTVLTWHSGWQMVGFSIAHTNPALLLIGVLGAVCAHVFFLVWLVMVIGRRIRSRPIPRPNVVLILTLGVMTGLLYVPYVAWMMLLVKVSGPGQNGSSYLSFAAAEHHPYLLKTLIDDGVTVDAPYAGHTALNAACVQKDLQAARYLISKGAKLSRAPDCESVSELGGKPERVRIPGTSVEVRP
jgi:hypothetical protein